MQIELKSKISDLIQQLEDPATSPHEAEKILGEILEPLLAEGGYELAYIGEQRDFGADFMARKVDAEVGNSDEIAIEYKHYRQGAVGVEAVHRVLGAAISSGLPRAMLVTNSRFTLAARETLRRSTPVKIELIDLDALRSWVGRIEQIPNVNLHQINIIRRELSRKFIELIAKNPRNLDQIEWREMEHLLTVVFDGLGFDAKLTPGSKDGGKDIILTCTIESEQHTYYVEIKHWRSNQRVGFGAVSDFLNVIINEEISGGLYLSTYGYCSNAFESLTEIQRQKIRFGAEEKVVSLCQSYVKAQSGIWSPESTLTETLFSGVQ